MTEEQLWPDGPFFEAAPAVFPLCSDTVWLGSFVRLRRSLHACDLCCGGGALGLWLLGREPSLRLTGIDASPEAIACFQRNLQRNGMNATLYCADLRACSELLPRGSFDLVTANPPYYPRSGGIAEGSRGDARQESCTVGELCAAAAWLTRQRGRFCLCYPPERLSELFCALTAAGLEPKRLRLVMRSAHSRPCTALVEAVRGGGTGLEIEAPLLTEEENG